MTSKWVFKFVFHGLIFIFRVGFILLKVIVLGLIQLFGGRLAYGDDEDNRITVNDVYSAREAFDKGQIGIGEVVFYENIDDD